MPRRFQFSLRVLLLALTVASVAAALARYSHWAKVARALADVNRCEARFQEEFSLLVAGKACRIDKASSDLDDARKQLTKIRGF